jgi:hypothetical protein
LKHIRPRSVLAALFLRRLRLAVFIAVFGPMSWQASAQDSAHPVSPAPGVPLPKLTLIPRTAKSVPLGTVVLGDTSALRQAPKENAVALDKYGYVEEEYFVSGTANLDAQDQAAGGANMPYTTRILVRRPVDASRFSGTVQLEPIGEGTQAVPGWTRAWPYFVSHHDVWVGVAISKANVETLQKKFDPVRYAPLNISDEGLRWDILAQVAWAMRSPDGPLGKLGFLDQAAVIPGLFRIYASGWSVTGCMQADFINKGHHARARRPDGRPLIDGYIVGACPTSGPIDVPADAAVIQVMSESEYGDDAAARSAVIAARRPDGNTAGDHRFRWYDVAGVADVGYPDQPQFSLAAYQAGAGKDAAADCGRPVSGVSTMSDIARAMFRNLDEWVRIGRYPPHGAVFQLNEDRTVKRDQYGNVLGGLRPYWTDAPSFKFTLCAHAGYEEPFSKDQFSKLYKDRDTYVEKVTDAVILLVNSRNMLAEDADALLAGLRENKTRQAALTGGG